jgi:TolA-binding protein
MQLVGRTRWFVVVVAAGSLWAATAAAADPPCPGTKERYRGTCLYPEEARARRARDARRAEERAAEAERKARERKTQEERREREWKAELERDRKADVERQREIARARRLAGPCAEPPFYDWEDFALLSWSEDAARSHAEQSAQRRKELTTLLGTLADDPYHPDKAELYFRVAEIHWNEAHGQWLSAMAGYARERAEFDAGGAGEPPIRPRPDYAASAGYFRRIASEFPQYARIDDVYYHLAVGTLHDVSTSLDRSAQKDAVRYFQLIVSEKPGSRRIADVHLHLGEYYLRNNSLYYAKVNFERIIRDHKSSVASWFAQYRLAWIYRGLGEPRRSLETLRDLLAATAAARAPGARSAFEDTALASALLIAAGAAVDQPDEELDWSAGAATDGAEFLRVAVPLRECLTRTGRPAEADWLGAEIERRRAAPR